jgi:hypothetical protein
MMSKRVEGPKSIERSASIHHHKRTNINSKHKSPSSPNIQLQPHISPKSLIHRHNPISSNVIHRAYPNTHKLKPPRLCTCTQHIHHIPIRYTHQPAAPALPAQPQPPQNPAVPTLTQISPSRFNPPSLISRNAHPHMYHDEQLAARRLAAITMYTTATSQD